MAIQIWMHHLLTDHDVAAPGLQVICEAATGATPALRESAYECMVKIVPNYYDTLPPYMETIFSLTKHAIEKDEEEVAKQAIEFWSSICEEEIDLIEVRPAMSLRPSSQPGVTCSRRALGTPSGPLTCQRLIIEMNRLCRVDMAPVLYIGQCGRKAIASMRAPLPRCPCPNMHPACWLVMHGDLLRFAHRLCSETVATSAAAMLAPQEDSDEDKCHYFVKTALQPLVEVLLGQLTKQEEGQDLDDNIWNVSMASGTALSLIAQTVADDIVPLAMPYVQVKPKSVCHTYQPRLQHCRRDRLWPRSMSG